MHKVLFCSIISFCLCGVLYSQTVTSIIVRGNKKISSEAVKAKLLQKQGASFNQSYVRQDIKNIFDLGYFDNVEVLRDDTSKNSLTLIYEVKEKPIVSSIIFEGNSDLESDDLTKHVTVKPYAVLSIAEVKRSKAQLLKYYEEKGFYLATVKEELRDAPPDPDSETGEKYIELVFKISENSKIRIDRIVFLGNKHIHDQELKAMMETKEKGPFSFMSGSGSYKENTVDIDRERIAFFYTTRGYPHAQVVGPITHVTPDKKWIYLTYTIDEGEKYNFGNVTFKTDDVLYSEEELAEKLVIKPDQLYNSMQVRQQIVDYQNMYGDKGYAFTNVVPVPTYNEDKKTVDFLFEIDKGRLVHFGKFKITGNNKTRDKVVRRELRINEGELYNNSRKELSRDKIMSLGYFDDVQFTQYVPKDAGGASQDVLNIDIEVKEKASTGQFMISAGYSTYEGFITMLQIQENNFLGFGQTVTLRASLSKISKLYYISFYDPYFLDTNWGWGVDLFRENRQAVAYDNIRTGFDTRFSYPLTDFVRAYIMYKLEESKTTWVSTLSNVFNPEVENGIRSSITPTIENDTRNDRLNPTRGMYNALSSEVAGVGGSKRFVKTVFDNRFYQGFFFNTVFRARLLFGNVFGYGGKTLPYSERFLMGGIDNLRGYDYLSLGPKVYDSDGNPYAVGGKNEVLATMELEFPIVSSAGIKGVFFVDAGNAFDNFTHGITTDTPLRYNWGAGVRWNSPMGPLRFEWGVPIARRAGESRTVFQFMIGPSF